MRETFMLFKLYQNTITAIRQWLEILQFAPRPEPVRIRVDQSEQAQRLAARQRRVLHSKYRN